MRTQWIFYGLEQGGYGNRYHITGEMTESEFLKKYGICVSIVSYFPISKINMEDVGDKEKFITQDEKIDTDAKLLKKKFGENIMLEVGVLCIGTVVGIDTLADFVKYRNEIKKPLKTVRPLKAFAQELIKIAEVGLDTRCAIEIMKEHEWQTLNIDWIKKKMPQVAPSADLTQFGVKPQNEQGLLK